MSQMVTMNFRRINRGMRTPMGPMENPHPSRRYGSTPHAICFIPGNRPDPLEESAASVTWREMTEHMRERDADI